MGAVYRFSPIGGPDDYRRDAGRLVMVLERGVATARDMPLVEFPTGERRRVAWRDLLSIRGEG